MCDDDPGATLGWPDVAVPSVPAQPLETAFVLGETLGEGGMSVVRRGVQRSLGREVAIKSTRSDGHVGRLVAEGRITGALEHPHIVPVHDVVQDHEGALHIVLKHVDGVPWSEVIHDEEEAAKRFGVDDLGAWNLDVLEAVTRAVEFAHAQGVLHRDLKPSNVMVGRFGQVYVVDWGVAVRMDELRDTPDQHRRIVGTPRYMAPELAAGRVEDQGPATDVYLLGAVLYEMVTGMGPHLGYPITAILERIPAFRVELDDQEPELEALIARAMAPSPADRFPSAEAFLRALRRYRRDRHARALLRQASAGVEALGALLSDERADRVAVYQAYGALRFGFEEAAREAPRLADGALREATLALARWELDQGALAAAESLLVGVSDVPAELAGRVEDLRAARVAQERRLAALEADAHHGIGRRSRNLVLLGICAFWALRPLATMALGLPVALTAVALVPLVFLLWGIRHRLLATRRNRTITSIVAAVALVEVLRAVALLLGAVDEAATAGGSLLASAALCVVATGLLDRRFWVPTAALVLTYLVLPWMLPYRALLGSANALVIGAVVVQVFDIWPVRTR